jgi:hypothetical protein
MLLVMIRTCTRLANILRIRTYCVHVHVRHHLELICIYIGPLDMTLLGPGTCTTSQTAEVKCRWDNYLMC